MRALSASCTGRPGILKLKRDGTLVLVASKDSKGKQPYVCKCECEAVEIVLSIAAKAAADVLRGHPIPDLPDPDDFVYCYVDQEPKDIPVTTFDEANSAIAAIRKL